ncbi:hypothetical protein [Streptomyces sp. NPDC046976]|uniref:hypothetical protein n=1 Tax=Streptomyces sp. NPDC046976 TaxID=3155258 RepID=UPI0033D75863
MRKSLASAAVVLIAATGCGGGTGDATGAASPTGRTDTTTPAVARHLTVTSTAYRDGGTVPAVSPATARTSRPRSISPGCPRARAP